MTEGISGSGNSLAAEARYLHTCLFRDRLDGRIAERYLAAQRQLFAGHGSPSLAARVVERQLEAESVEFALS